jgi:hypothetical protein
MFFRSIPLTLIKSELQSLIIQDEREGFNGINGHTGATDDAVIYRDGMMECGRG